MATSARDGRGREKLSVHLQLNYKAPGTRPKDQGKENSIATAAAAAVSGCVDGDAHPARIHQVEKSIKRGGVHTTIDNVVARTNKLPNILPLFFSTLSTSFWFSFYFQKQIVDAYSLATLIWS